MPQKTRNFCVKLTLGTHFDPSPFCFSFLLLMLCSHAYSHAPTSLLNVAFGQPVEVKVAHRMQEDYKPPPKQPMKAFQGSGNRLGSVTPGESYGSSEAIPGAFPGAQSGSSGTAPTGAATVEVDQSLPVTSIQIRLGDGTRWVALFLKEMGLFWPGLFITTCFVAWLSN